MHIQSDKLGLVVRLYDHYNDNPNELNIVRVGDGRVNLAIEDRDGGNAYMQVTVTREELTAALAVIDAPIVSVDAPDGGFYAR